MITQKKLYKTTLAAMFAALIFVATAFFMIPLPGNGYANVGDCFVIVGALLLGPLYGAAAAGIGSALADLFLGFGLYAPATFVIKALMAMAAALLYQAIKKTGFRYHFLAVAAVSVVAEIMMAAGYFVFEWIFLGMAVASVNGIGNMVQGMVGLVASTVLFSTLQKTGLAERIIKSK